MASLAVLLITILAVSAAAAWKIARSRGYDSDLFMLGGLLCGPLAVLAALNAHKYAPETDEDALPTELEPINELKEQPQRKLQVGSMPSLEPEAGIFPREKPEVPIMPPIGAPKVNTPTIPAFAPETAMPPLPNLNTSPMVPPLPQSKVPSLPVDLSAPPLPGAAGVPPLPGQGMPPLPGPAAHAPPIPTLADPLPIPALPQEDHLPAIPSLTTDSVHFEHENEEAEASEAVQVDEDMLVLEEQSEVEAAQELDTHSMIDIITAERAMPVRTHGAEVHLDGEDAPKGKRGKKKRQAEPDLGLAGQLAKQAGIPLAAIAPGQVTEGTCPHCHQASWADWYGLCSNCLKPFPVQIPYFDPVAKAQEELLGQTEEGSATPAKKGKLKMPNLKR